MADGGCVLVTGAAGFIGSHTARALMARGQAVVGVDNFDPFYERSIKDANVSALTGAGMAFVEMDICDCAALERVMREHGVGSVVHLAAKAGVRPSIADPVGYAVANVDGTQSVLSASSAAGVERVVAASSSSVYGNNEKVPFSEEDSVEEPISPYAATKRANELMAWTHHHLTGMPVAMLRFFTVYGPGQRPDLAISKFLRWVDAGEKITMFGDGSTSRDYTYIDDIVSGVLAALDRVDGFGYRVWNLGGEKPATLKEMIAAVGEVVGKGPVVEAGPPMPGDVDRTWADLTRSKAELGYAPTTGLKAGMAKQWEAARGG